MSRSRRVVASAVSMLAGVALVAFPASPVSAAGITATGWWYRAATENPSAESPVLVPGAPTVPVIAPPPPTVGEGELHVEGTASGATAMAAITIALAEGESSPILTIEPTDTSVVPPEALILACRAAIEWTVPEESPGTWESKPLADCSTSVQAQPTEDGKLVFPLQTLVQGTVLDVVFVAGSDPSLPAGAQGSSFSLTFAKPGPGSLVTTQSASAFEPSSDFASSFDPAIESPLTDEFGLPAVADPLPAPPVAPALEPQEQAPSIPRVARVAAPVPLDGAPRALGLLLLFAGAVGAYLAANQAPRQTIGLGRFRRVLPAGSSEAVLSRDPARPAEIVERGLGRLRRARIGAPPAL